VEGMGAGAAEGEEMEAERKKSSGRSSHDEEAAAAAGDGEAKGLVAPPGSAIGEIGGQGPQHQQAMPCRVAAEETQAWRPMQCPLGGSGPVRFGRAGGWEGPTGPVRSS